MGPLTSYFRNKIHNKGDVIESKKRLVKTLKVLSLVLAGIFFFRLFSYDYFVFQSANATAIIPNGILRRLYYLLRAVTYAGILISILNPFFSNKYYRTISGYIVPIIAIINLAIIPLQGRAFLGNDSLWNLRVLQFALEEVVLLGIGILSFGLIALEDFEFSKKDLLKTLGVLVAVLFVTMEPSFMSGIFGLPRISAVDLTMTHRIYIYISFLVPLGLYFLFRKKPFEDRYLVTLTIALGAFMMYFGTFAFNSFLSLSSWPLHLCNTAIILMAIAFIFRSKTFFYFNYFINVLGAFCAIIMPNTTGFAFSINAMHFWSNHWVAFFLPLLGVALGVFPRANFKMVLKALLVFSIYFLLMTVINSWFTNYDPNVNYFFLNDDFLAKKFTFAIRLRNKYIWTWTYKDLKFILYPAYWLGIYIGFVILTFIIWFAYEAVFQVSDGLKELFYLKGEKKKALAQRQQELQLEAGGETNMIKVEHFTKRYGKSNRNAVEDLNLEIKKGEIFGFLGHNGAGKSTFIKSLVGIQSITSGKINVCGYDCATQALATKKLIGYVPDNHAIYERLTGREYVNYIADLYMVSKEDRVARLDRYAKMFDIVDALDRQIKGYSHGMKQKITVISALIHNPQVWVLDEPLTGLDPKSCYQIKECMKEHAKAGNIVFFSSHVIEVVENICDRIAIIRGGKLMLTSTIADLKKKNIDLEHLFLEYVNATDEEIKQMKQKQEEVHV